MLLKARACWYAALAQPVEHIIRNDGVRCSSHLSGTSHSFLHGEPRDLRQPRDFPGNIEALIDSRDGGGSTRDNFRLQQRGTVDANLKAPLSRPPGWLLNRSRTLGEPKRFSLLPPIERQCRRLDQRRSSQLFWLGAIEDPSLDVGCEITDPQQVGCILSTVTQLFCQRRSDFSPDYSPAGRFRVGERSLTC